MRMLPAHLIAAVFAAAAFVLPGFAPAHAQGLEQPAVKFTLEWAFQGPQSIFTYAAESGAFKGEGLTVQVDRGAGSADAVSRVATGTYEFGWAEMSAVIKYNADHPERPLMAVYVTHENSANAVMSIKGRGIAVPKDLEGKKVGSTAGSAARDVFDAFARINGFDPARIKTETVSGALRETMLVRGDVDAILGATTSGVFTIKSLGTKMEDIIVMPYGKFGVELYGHAVITTAAYAEKNPKTVAAFVRAVNKSLIAAIANPRASVASLKARDGLANLDLEHDRLLLMLRDMVVTPTTRAEGLGTVSSARMKKTMQSIYDAYGIKTAPMPEKVYTDRFLPPKAERLPPAIGS